MPDYYITYWVENNMNSAMKKGNYIIINVPLVSHQEGIMIFMSSISDGERENYYCVYSLLFAKLKLKR